MSDTKLNNLSKDLYNLMLNLHRKIFNHDEMMKNLPIPPSHVKVILYLKHNGDSSISEIAKNLLISKPNMTPIIDKLVSENMVNRYNDPNDRRILRIELTSKAHEFIKKQEEMIKNTLSEKISVLSSEDLEYLGHHVTGVIDILGKIK
ncbi:MarR family winged helix-turn-helix transcriptional regulator [Clostridium lundense]|uniref:MarR family winged helix-turn-helix transcriptional regulator n=1 Tax=Clostridium lundense TaxID=319475 RepID=UPI000484CABC|nr:MarR family transcriptional regulator [Clostridium lundense]